MIPCPIGCGVELLILPPNLGFGWMGVFILHFVKGACCFSMLGLGLGRVGAGDHKYFVCNLYTVYRISGCPAVVLTITYNGTQRFCVTAKFSWSTFKFSLCFSSCKSILYILTWNQLQMGSNKEFLISVWKRQASAVSVRLHGTRQAVRHVAVRLAVRHQRLHGRHLSCVTPACNRRINDF